jgi:hypothetical protein
MRQVGSNTINEILHNGLDRYFADQAKCATTHKLVWRFEVLPKSINSQGNFVLDTTIHIGFLNDFPIQEKKALDPMIFKALEVGKDLHKNTRVVFIVTDETD